MILFEEAEHIILNSAFQFPTEKVELNKSLGRILAVDVKSDVNMPPFDKSAMDGFACKRDDIQNELEVLEVIRAGMVPRETVGKNQCSKIMTGGMLPDGADCVIMVEYVKEIGENKIRYTKEKTFDNICYKAEDIKTEDVVLKEGTLIKAQHIAILASVGISHPEVYKKPVVSILSTGNELVEPGVKLSASQIRNSNGYQLYNQVLAMGAEPRYDGIVADSKDETFKKMNHSLNSSDVVILSGGVSMGDFDFVPEILKRFKANIHFKEVAIQPGKPIVFAQIGKRFVFALPGNPVSSFTTFELFVKPFLFKLMGHEYNPIAIRMPYGTDFSRKRVDRKKWIPVKIEENGMVMPVDYHGSAHIYALENTQGFVSINIGESEIKKGELVDVRQI